MDGFSSWYGSSQAVEIVDFGTAIAFMPDFFRDLGDWFWLSPSINGSPVSFFEYSTPCCLPLTIHFIRLADFCQPPHHVYVMRMVAHASSHSGYLGHTLWT